jgi:hypothetical protein
MWKPALVAFVVLATSPSAFAQWLDYPTAGIPRTADGKPNLAAPTPRTPGELMDYYCLENEKDAIHLVGK